MKKENKKHFSKINKYIAKIDDLRLRDEGEYENLEIDGADLRGQSFSSLDFKDCLIKNCNFNQVKIKNLSFLNVRFENCDLANLEVEEFYVKKTDFYNCRMTGFSAPEGIFY